MQMPRTRKTFSRGINTNISSFVFKGLDYITFRLCCFYCPVSTHVKYRLNRSGKEKRKVAACLRRTYVPMYYYHCMLPLAAHPEPGDRLPVHGQDDVAGLNHGKRRGADHAAPNFQHLWRGRWVKFLSSTASTRNKWCSGAGGRTENRGLIIRQLKTKSQKITYICVYIHHAYMHTYIYTYIHLYIRTYTPYIHTHTVYIPLHTVDYKTSGRPRLSPYVPPEKLYSRRPPHTLGPKAYRRTSLKNKNPVYPNPPTKRRSRTSSPPPWKAYVRSMYINRFSRGGLLVD